MNNLNTAQKLRQSICIEVPSEAAGKQVSPKHTKSGPGRRHVQGSGLRSDKSLKQRSAGSYGRGLRNWITRKNLDALDAKRAA